MQKTPTKSYNIEEGGHQQQQGDDQTAGGYHHEGASSGSTYDNTGAVAYETQATQGGYEGYDEGFSQGQVSDGYGQASASSSGQQSYSYTTGQQSHGQSGQAPYRRGGSGGGQKSYSVRYQSGGQRSGGNNSGAHGSSYYSRNQNRPPHK